MGNRTDESHMGPEEQVSQKNQAHSVSLDENEDDIGSEAAIILDKAMYQNGGDYSFRKRSKMGGG